MNQRFGKFYLQRLSRCSRLSALLVLVATATVSAPAMGEMVVYTVNYPLAYFAERIGGDSVSVHFPAPEKVDPAFWKPDAEIIAAYQSADLILLNGAGYAGWIRQASLPRRKLVDTSRSFRGAYLPREEAPVHQHGPAGEHAHGRIAFTTWLDLEQAIVQARAIGAAFAKADSEDAPDFARRTDALIADLEKLDEDLAAVFAAMAGESLLASHPIYAYLARRYGLDLRALIWEPDADPNETDWRILDTLLAEQPARWMLWEAEPLEVTRRKLASRGIDILVFAVASNRPTQGDFLATMRANLETLDRALKLTVPLVPR